MYDCGGYEQGFAYLKAHATEITPEFVADLRAVSMDLQTEQAKPELAAVFAKLGIVAALLLGRNAEIGMAFYCKGSILMRQGLYLEAIALLDEALPYLRNANDLRQLASSLYDMAICYDKIGNVGSALRLLREVLTYQQDEKDRVDTLAFMLVLTARSSGDPNELIN